MPLVNSAALFFDREAETVVRIPFVNFNDFQYFMDPRRKRLSCRWSPRNFLDTQKVIKRAPATRASDWLRPDSNFSSITGNRKRFSSSTGREKGRAVRRPSLSPFLSLIFHVFFFPLAAPDERLMQPLSRKMRFPCSRVAPVSVGGDRSRHSGHQERIKMTMTYRTARSFRVLTRKHERRLSLGAWWRSASSFLGSRTAGNAFH